jgi:hypothetical protein
MSAHQPTVEEIDARMESALLMGSEAALACLHREAEDLRFTKQVLTKLSPHFGFKPYVGGSPFNLHLEPSDESMGLLHQFIDALNAANEGTTNLGKKRHVTLRGQFMLTAAEEELWRIIESINSQLSALKATIHGFTIQDRYAMIELDMPESFIPIYWGLIDSTNAYAHPNGKLFIPSWLQTIPAEQARDKLANIEAFGTHSIPADRSKPKFHITVYYGAIPADKKEEFSKILRPLIGEEIVFDRIGMKLQNPDGSIDAPSSEGGAAAV